MKKIIICLVMMLMVLTGCQQDLESEPIADNTVRGRSVYVHDSGIAFFGYNNLICTAKCQEGALSEFTIEGGLTGDIYALAVYKNALYISASDGIFKYDLDMFTSGQSSAKPTVLWDKHLSEFNHFEILDDKLFFVYGTTLCYIPTEGGAKTEVATEVVDFEVADKGIYYTKKDGSLHITDLKNDTSLAELGGGFEFQVFRDKLFYVDNGQVKAYSASKGDIEDYKTEQMVNEYEGCVWVYNGNILYRTEDFDVRLVTADEEKSLGDDVRYPGKVNGFMKDNYLLRAARNTIKVYDLMNGSTREYDLDTEMKSMLSQLSQPDEKTSQQNADYNILNNMDVKKDGDITYIYGNGFLLTMPTGYEDWEIAQNEGDAFSIIYTPGKNAGYGGHLVTIKAYEPGDTSYEQLPSYHVAGRNADKVFIAIYPTDVQWDMNNKSQGERFRDISDYLQKIGEGAVNSPFQTADSD